MISKAQYKQRVENNTKLAKARRAKTKCRRGHNNWRIRPSNGRRYCRTCANDALWYWRHGMSVPID